jgi:hypothetical protein
MRNLQTTDLRRFSEALEQIYEPIQLDEFPKRLFAVIGSLIPDSIMSVEDIDLQTGGHTASLNFEVENEANIAPRSP